MTVPAAGQGVCARLPGDKLRLQRAKPPSIHTGAGGGADACDLFAGGRTPNGGFLCPFPARRKEKVQQQD